MNFTYKRPAKCLEIFTDNSIQGRIFRGNCETLINRIPDDSVDLIVTSPPYCMGKRYREFKNLDEFVSAHKRILPEIIRITKPGGSICWQIGTYVYKQEIIPLEYLIWDILNSKRNVLKLRNQIKWAYGHGLHCESRFSGRHETILWYTKGDDYTFNLDEVRVPQKYPGKKHSSGPKKGQFSGNPLGKNPGDLWQNIPNVKANHVEKTIHPCQFPVGLAARLIKCLSNVGEVIFDPFSGVSSTGVAALLENRRYLGAEIEPTFVSIGDQRLNEVVRGESRIRPEDKDLYIPKGNESVVKVPEHFWK